MSKVDLVLEERVHKQIEESQKLKSNGKLLEALECLENYSSSLGSLSFGVFLKVALEVASLCNKLHLHFGNQVTFLQKAEKVLNSCIAQQEKPKWSCHTSILKYLLLTYNNWATFHQNNSNFHKALGYLTKALKLINPKRRFKNDMLQLIAKTKLNISSIFLQLNRINEAVDYAEQSLVTLQTELKRRVAKTDYWSMKTKDKVKFKVMIRSFVVAFYNIGIAEEVSENLPKMLEAYQNAVMVGDQFLSQSDNVLELARKALEEANLIAINSQYFNSETSTE